MLFMQCRITVLVTQHHNRLPKIIALLPVLPLSYICPPSHQNNGTSSTSEPSINNKADTNSATGSNSGTAHTHHGTSTGSTGNHHNDNTKSHDLAQKIINKIKQKFKVGDVPFP